MRGGAPRVRQGDSVCVGAGCACVREISRAWPEISCGLIEICCPAIDTPRAGIEAASHGLAASRSFISNAGCEVDRPCTGVRMVYGAVNREGPAVAALWTAIGALSERLENVLPAVPVAFRTPRTR